MQGVAIKVDKKFPSNGLNKIKEARRYDHPDQNALILTPEKFDKVYEPI